MTELREGLRDRYALEPLLDTPYYLSPGWLRIDPTFDLIRKHPRFQRLIQDGAGGARPRATG